MKNDRKQDGNIPVVNVPMAVIGIGCLFPKAANPGDFWANIREGVDAITEVPASHWDPEDYFHPEQATPDMTYARRGGFIDAVDFNPLLYGMSPNNIEATDTTQLLGMVVARQALLDAGYSTGKDAGDGREFDRDRTSVILGVTGTLELVISLGARLGHPHWRKALAGAGVDAATAEEVVQRIADAYVSWQENSFPGLLGNVAAGRIANRFDLGGTNCVVDAACASSLSAIHLATMELAAGRCDMAISGGMDTFNDIFMYMCFSKTPALSPTGNSRPFDRNGDGTILGEGLGAVVLKRLQDAQRDSDHIYAVIRGMGTSSDGRGNAIYTPSANGQTKALRDAYVQARVPPASIEMVEAHGTGTVVGDAVEAEALAGVYREDKPDGTWCAIGSVKSMIGHTKAAAGVAGLIKTAMALKNKVIPPTIKVDQPLPQLEPGKAPVYVNTIKRPWLASADHPRRAAVSSFGFGGSNFHCVLEEAEADKTAIEWDGRVILLTCSTGDKEQLIAKLGAIDPEQPWPQLRRLAAQSCQVFDKGHKERVVMVLEKDKTDPAQLLQAVNKMLLNPDDARYWQLPAGAWYGSGAMTGKLGVLFPGQGSQYVGMLRDLACQFPQMIASLANANAALKEAGHGLRLSDLVYPVPVFTEEARRQQEETLRATQNAQPALGTVSLAAMRILEHFGVNAEVTAGHSYGELVALCAAGRIDEDALYRLSRWRGELMADGQGDRGAMLAVAAPAEEVQKVLDAWQIDLVVANHNAPSQVVLSGATAEIEKAADLFRQHNLRATRLPVSAGFHSRFVAEAETPFAGVLASIVFHQGERTVLSNTIADIYPGDSDAAKSLLAGQLARPVEFVREIEKMVEMGVHTFIEVGPGGRLTGLVKSILDGREHHAFALDSSSGKRNGQIDLACLLAALSALGHDIKLDRWDAGYLDIMDENSDKKPVMTIPICGANYVKPRAQCPPSAAKTIQHEQQTEQDVTREHESGHTFTTAGDSRIIDGNIDSTQLTEALRVTQQSILTLQGMQEQTANLHRQYLEGQETAQHTIRQLLAQQQRLLGLSPQFPDPVHDTGPVLSRQPEKPEPVSRHTEDSHGADQIPGNKVQALVQTVDNSDTDAATGSGTDNIHNVLLEVVSEKTGYPLDMLSLDMSLDTDLGIDSIKRVEILSALQERLPWAPTINPEELGTFQFLQHIVEFLADSVREKASTTYEEAGDKETVTSVVDSDLQETLLAIVADKTGYPGEMLSLEMSLDTDLGIDSIKRVEILSALQERLPELPAVTPEELGNLQTLQQIIDHIVGNHSKTTGLTANNTVSGPVPADVLLDVVADKTGYPVEMLNFDMSLDSDLGIDSIKRVEILSALQERLPDMPAIKAEELGGIQTLQQIVALMTDTVDTAAEIQTPLEKGDSVAADAVCRIERSVVKIVPLSEKEPRQAVMLPAGAVVWVTDDGTGLTKAVCKALKAKGLTPEVVGMDAPATGNKPAGLIILAPAEVEDDYILAAFRLIQNTSPYLHRKGGEEQTVLVGVSRLGGRFGMEKPAGINPICGGLAGLVKTADREWPEVACKVLDLPQGRKPGELAEFIVDESLTQGPLEVGLGEDGSCTVTMTRQFFDIDMPLAVDLLDEGDVVVVSGGARGVTAGVAAAFSKAYKATLLLLGRSPAPEAEADWLQGLESEADIKKAIYANSHQDAMPGDIENEYHAIMANREIRETLRQIESGGGKAVYRTVDVRDVDAVSAIIREARTSLGPVRGLIHAAGVLADRLIEDKTMEQFEQVYGTKVQGLRSLLQATDEDDLRFLTLFSSTTARYGRKGQCDYAAANEVLNKMAQREKAGRPDCRVVSVNWGPWDGGMVTPALKKRFAEEGIGTIPLQAGADYLLQELSRPGPVEVVILGGREGAAAGDTVGIEKSGMHVAFERRLSVAEYPFLKSHVMNGRAVLPVAMMVEWFGHGAMHDNPGLHYIGFDDLRVFKGVTLDRGTDVDLQILAGLAIKTGDIETVPVALRCGDTLHAQARVVLAAGYSELPQPVTADVAGAYPFNNDQIYQSGRLFHGPALHGIKSIEACSDKGMVAQVQAAPRPLEWMEKPIRSTWLSDPLALDASFQMMILWCFQQLGTGSLPTVIARYRQYQRSFPREGSRVVVHIDQYTDHNTKALIEFLDHNDNLIALIEGYECVSDASLNKAFTRNQLDVQTQD